MSRAIVIFLAVRGGKRRHQLVELVIRISWSPKEERMELEFLGLQVGFQRI